MLHSPRQPPLCIPIGYYCPLGLNVVACNVFANFFAAPVILLLPGFRPKPRLPAQLALRNLRRISNIQMPNFASRINSYRYELPGGIASELCYTRSPTPVRVDSS